MDKTKEKEFLSLGNQKVNHITSGLLFLFVKQLDCRFTAPK